MAARDRSAVSTAEADGCAGPVGDLDLRWLAYRFSLELISRSLDASLREFLR